MMARPMTRFESLKEFHPLYPKSALRGEISLCVLLDDPSMLFGDGPKKETMIQFIRADNQHIEVPVRQGHRAPHGTDRPVHRSGKDRSGGEKGPGSVHRLPHGPSSKGSNALSLRCDC